jgi:hypothetical protein
MAEQRGNALPVGYELDDFRVVEVLGRGGFGITYKAMDERLRREVAIKEYLPGQFAYRGDDFTVLPRDDSDKEMFLWGLTRFIDEARALAMFRHPNIIAVIRYLEANGTAYLVMEYEEGCDLEAWLRLHPGGVVEEVLVHKVLLPLLDGLEKVHGKGLLHRDIKPDNVFMRRDGTPVLIDFGASRPHGNNATTNLTSLISVGYSPFEQYGGGGRQGPWSDFYALAGTLYRVVAGQKPADAIARQQGEVLMPAVDVAGGRYSETFLSAIDHALALDPSERPQTAAEFRAMVLGVATDRSATDAGATVLRRPANTRSGRGARRRSAPLWWGFGALGIIAAAGVFYLQEQRRERLTEPAGRPFVTERDTRGTVDGPQTPGGEPADAGSAAPATADPGPRDTMAAPPARVAEAAVLDEDAILSGLSVSAPVRDFREAQISGAMLAYVSNKTQFDACRESGCAEIGPLMNKVQQALEGYDWERSPVSGSIRIVNPRRLENEECPFMLQMEEIVRSAGEERQQTRTYCTRNGFDRELQAAGEVEL